jgi:DNA polymerase-4
MEKLPISVLSQRFGNLGRRIWYMCQGADPDPLHPDIVAPKSIGHGKVMPPNTRDQNTVLTYLQHMCSKVGTRMRRYNLQAKTYWIGFRTDAGWLGSKSQLSTFSNDQQQIYRLGRYVMALSWQGEGIHQIQVTALDPQPAALQMELFSNRTLDDDHQPLNAVMDNINERYGEFTLSPARLLNRSEMPNVIAPAWKPDGLRQTI